MLGNLEQEPKPADGRGNERNRKYSVLQTAKHQKRYRAAKGKAGGELQAFRAEHHNAGI